MKKTAFIVTLFFALVIATVSYATVEVTIFDNTFVRGTGAPVTEIKTFPGVSGKAIIKLYNGGASDADIERVSSSTITINGQVIFGSANFNQNVSYLEQEVSLYEGQNTLQVILKSKSGGKITVRITQEINAEAAAVIGASGGEVKVCDPNSSIYGVAVDIPYGALNENKLISISGRKEYVERVASEEVLIKLEPTGLLFTYPISIQVPYDTTTITNGTRLTAALYSEANEIKNLGSEVSISEQKEVQIINEGLVQIEVNHFSQALFTTVKDVYIVLDIRPENLTRGDILYTLTSDYNIINETGTFDWLPGHVGMFLGKSLACNPTSDFDINTFIESVPLSVRTGNWTNFVKNPIHIYMGARKPVIVTDSERAQAVVFAHSKCDFPYLIIGKSNYANSLSGFTCVGLIEEAYESAGINITPWSDSLGSLGGLIPIQQFNRTIPINEISVDISEVNKRVQFDVRGVINTSPDFRQAYSDSHDYYAINHSSLPPRATFDYSHFDWTPDCTDVGKSYSINFTVTSHANGIEDSQILTLKTTDKTNICSGNVNPPSNGTAPTVTRSFISNVIYAYSAAIHLQVVPNDPGSVTAWVEYSTNNTFTTSLASALVALIPGGTPQDVTCNLTNLFPNTKYYWRAKVQNRYGIAVYNNGDSFTTTPNGLDTIAPMVISTFPVNNALSAVNGAVSVTFSEAMDSSTISAVSILMNNAGNGLPVAGMVTANGVYATFTPAASLSQSTTYRVTVKAAVKDLAGNPMGQDYTWSFTTLVM